MRCFIFLHVKTVSFMSKNTSSVESNLRPKLPLSFALKQTTNSILTSIASLRTKITSCYSLSTDIVRLKSDRQKHLAFDKTLNV